MRHLIDLIENGQQAFDWSPSQHVMCRSSCKAEPRRSFRSKFFRFPSIFFRSSFPVMTVLVVGDAELKDSPYREDEQWFMHITVAPSHQRLGIGKQLVDRALAAASRSPRKHLVVSSFTVEGDMYLSRYLRDRASKIPGLEVWFNDDGGRRLTETKETDYPLYHGTSFLRACGILSSNMIRGCNEGDYDDDACKIVGVSLTRDITHGWSFAGHAADLNRQNLEDFLHRRVKEGNKGVVLVFSAADLHRSFTVENDPESFSHDQRWEQEERVHGNLTNVSAHLKGVMFDPDDLDAIEADIREVATKMIGDIRAEMVEALGLLPRLRSLRISDTAR
jgi:GNAT superfamily N-acetyltransferase